MSGLLKLAERCEAATGPDNELDCEILAFERASAGLEMVWEDDGVDLRARGLFVAGGPWEDVPAYTASIDAAMTLVPEGGYPQISRTAPDKWRVNIGFGNRAKGVNAEAATPALALCAAALRARSEAAAVGGR